MGWRDYNQGNMSAFDGDLRSVEVKMRQIIQEQDEKKEETDKVERDKRDWEKLIQFLWTCAPKGP